jgi:ribonuclease BN (tRNA processing enzyme)
MQACGAHEVWLSDDEVKDNADDLTGHSFASGAVKIASDAGVRTLWPIHLHPKKTARQIEILVKSMQRDRLRVICPPEGAICDF